jgi:predicted acylesterase/phospholipase RssA
MRALVISGGGGRFWYGAGALATLKKQGEEFDMVYGTSTGAICAMLWMQGNPQGAWEMTDKIKPTDLVKDSYRATKLHRFARAKPLADNRPMLDTLRTHFPRHTLDFSFKSHAVATNILTQRREVFELRENDPDIYRYIVASCAIPALFKPVRFNDELVCVDGSAIDNCLLTPAVKAGATKITLIVLTEEAATSNVNPEDLFDVIGAVTDGTLTHSVTRDLKLTEARNHLPGFKPIRVQLIRPARRVPIELFDWTPEQAREAFDMGTVDALNMETVIDESKTSIIA